ncbi:MAG: anthranilate synthase component I, partial [Candidatus Promineifilaceae bacterium]
MDRQIYRPALAEFRRLAAEGASLIPVVRAYPADLETPVTVYLKLMDAPGPSFLLESVEGGEQVSRYSFVGVEPRGVLSLSGGEVSLAAGGRRAVRPLAEGEDLLHVLKAELGRCRAARLAELPRFSGGAAGYLGYD